MESKSVFVLTPAQKKLFEEEYSAMEKRMKMLIDNQQLYRFYKRANCEKYTNIHDATSTKLLNNQILVFLPAIECYGIFTAESYHQFLQNILDYEEDNETKLEFGAKQIILTGSSQKVIILCAGAHAGNNASTIQKHIREYFKSDVDVRNNSESEIEIMIKNRTVNGFADATELFHGFYDYIYNKDKDLSDKISMPKIHLSKSDKYIQRNISFDSGPISIVDIVNALATTHACENLQVNINIGHNNTINAPINIKDSAQEWIRENPPKEKEVTTNYYKRYSAANNKPIADNQFGKLVRNEGYYTARNADNSRHWKK